MSELVVLIRNTFLTGLSIVQQAETVSCPQRSSTCGTSQQVGLLLANTGAWRHGQTLTSTTDIGEIHFFSSHLNKRCNLG